MKIKFFSNYDRPEGLLKRFLANYNVWDNEISFTIAEDYDFAVVFNQTSDLIMPSAKIITVIQEPSWSPAHQYTKFLKGSDYLIVHDAKLFEQKLGFKLGGTVIESPSYMFYDDRVDKTFFHYASSTQKVRKLSIIVSYLNVPLGIYQKRTALLKKILESDLDIDIYGRKLAINDPRYKGYIDYKFTGLLPYEYSIAIENSEEKNYLTEKFVDCVLCNTIPIYHGAPNAADIYDRSYFRQLDLDSPTVIEDIKSIIAIPAPYSTVNKMIYFKEYNLYKKLKEIVLN
ncbi:MAG: glycosyltransferase family 10 [Pedobacter sp.]|uniref:glycosyltransferase family 10 domain-containing protein n=1 Tax=Pedobacter sp. TaxID=1411316 RepID=UPI003390AFF6